MTAADDFRAVLMPLWAIGVAIEIAFAQLFGPA